MSVVHGLDVSDWQANVNWPAVKAAGYSFAYAKATEGTTGDAESYARNMRDGVSAGLLMGAYHFHKFSEDPVSQAHHFLAVAQPKAGDLPPMLDLEDTGGSSASQRVADIASFLHIVEKKIGARCILYMSYGFWSGSLNRTDGFTGHPLWIAQYEYGATEASTPQGGRFLSNWPITFWQHTDREQIPGAGSTDGDWFEDAGTHSSTQALEDLKAMVLK